MLAYLLRRLLLLPLTLFCIVLVNFAIINLAPGDPSTFTSIGADGDAARRSDRSMAFGSDDRYLQFREHYGLTLPILFNDWPFLDKKDVYASLEDLARRQPATDNPNALSVKQYNKLRVKFGDQARFIMPKLLEIIQEPSAPQDIRAMAMRFFVRGGTRQAIVGTKITAEDRAHNETVARDNRFLSQQLFLPNDSPEDISLKVAKVTEWYRQNKENYSFEPTFSQKIAAFFFETRFCRYMSRVFTLDFGTMRNDSNKTVIDEVVKRFKYSLTLAILPLLITFFLCQLFAMIMAVYQGRPPDYGLNFVFLILYAIPVFVAAPFLIESAIQMRTFPFSNLSIPISGFTSPDAVYFNQDSLQRLGDIATHLVLPIIAVMYGSLAAQTRLSRTAVLEVLRQDYVRTARAKGLPFSTVMVKHVGRNAAITIVTSIAGSLGVVLGGSLIVETLFEINGFGKFFYDAVINRDYNVVMFSALAGSFLSLLGYLIADIAYMLLDPRVNLE
jgi:peptide/nickel transport system permease protein